jgi:hypothetical protein
MGTGGNPKVCYFKQSPSGIISGQLSWQPHWVTRDILSPHAYGSMVQTPQETDSSNRPVG